MKNSIDRAITAALSLAVFAMAAVLVRREILKARADDDPPLAPPTYVSEWAALTGAGNTIGNAWAPVQIIEFGDLQCPACRGYQRLLEEIQQEFGGRVAVVFLHYPLPYHKEALPSALAAECAANQGRLGEFVSLAYKHQDSLGLKPYSALARDAGVGNLEEFEGCLRDKRTADAVLAEKRKGELIGIDGTPTILVNGWRYKASPTKKPLVALIESVLSGRTPAPLSAATGAPTALSGARPPER